MLFFFILFEHLFYPSILLPTVSQLIANKKPKFGPKVSEVSSVQPWLGPKVGSVAWYHCEKEPPVPKLGRFKALADYDYLVLGEGIQTEGAPDFKQAIFYPPMAFLIPFGDLSWKDFMVWSWLEASKAAGKPISNEESLWSSYLSTKENKEEAAKLWSIFKLENTKELDIDQEFEYDKVYPNTPSIDTNMFGIPKGEWYSL
jgi:hypothetical protein